MEQSGVIRLRKIQHESSTDNGIGFTKTIRSTPIGTAELDSVIESLLRVEVTLVYSFYLCTKIDISPDRRQTRFGKRVEPP